MKFNHHMFANDLVLLYKANMQSIMAIVSTSNEFAKTSGLPVSKEKSQFYFFFGGGGSRII